MDMQLETQTQIMQYAVFVVKPALIAIHAYSAKALVLVTGTAYTESHLHYLHQIHGPATGFTQLEASTYRDMYVNYINHRPALAHALSKLGNSYEQLLYRLNYGAALCRIHYMRFHAPLPKINPHAMCSQYLEMYNSAKGKATMAKCTKDFALVIKSLHGHLK